MTIPDEAGRPVPIRAAPDDDTGSDRKTSIAPFASHSGTNADFTRSSNNIGNRNLGRLECKVYTCHGQSRSMHNAEESPPCVRSRKQWTSILASRNASTAGHTAAVPLVTSTSNSRPPRTERTAIPPEFLREEGTTICFSAVDALCTGSVEIKMGRQPDAYLICPRPGGHL